MESAKAFRIAGVFGPLGSVVVLVQCGSSGALWQGFIDFGTSPEYFVRIREKCLKKVIIETKEAVPLFSLI